MSYQYERFGTTVLPTRMTQAEIGSGAVNLGLMDLPGGGAFDPNGTAQARHGQRPIKLNGTILGSTPTDLDTQYRGLLAMVGKRDKLYRRSDLGTIEWITARVQNVSCTREVGNKLHLPINISFVGLSPCWYGEHHGIGWLLDAGYYLDTGKVLDEELGDVNIPMPAAGNVTVTNNGNYPVRNAIISITAAGSNITALTLGGTGWDLAYTGTILAGKTLVIDCGAFTVLNDGVDDFAHLARGVYHTIPEWSCINSGSNILSTTRTGGDNNSSISFTFDEGWN
jgi:hypothetical protein